MDTERRRTPRYRMDLACEVQLVIPTATARPGKQQARLVDMNLGGARVSIPAFRQALFQNLLAGRAYAKISMRLAALGGKEARLVNLAGRIVWADFDSLQQQLQVGLEFDASDSESSDMVRSILQASRAK